MKGIRGMVLVGVILLLGGGCTSRPAEQASVTVAGGANGSLFPSADSAPSHSGKLFTAMAPRDAALAAARTLNEKFGLEVGSDGHFSSGFNDQNFGGDHFSANAQAQSASGKTILMEFEWIKEGETEVTLTSNLPDAQYEAVVAVIRSAIMGADYK
jgi:hypothetical protein